MGDFLDAAGGVLSTNAGTARDLAEQWGAGAVRSGVETASRASQMGDHSWVTD
jgi:hypothetical protein